MSEKTKKETNVNVTEVELLKNKVELKEIPLKDLIPSPLNKYQMEHIDDMVGSIKSLSLLTPLSVIGPDENGKYQILAGERRYRALSIINNEDNKVYEKVPCYVVGNEQEMDKLEQELIIEVTNIETRDGVDKDEHRFNIMRILHDMEEVGLIRHRKITQESGKYMKCSPRYQRMYRQIFEKGSEDLKELIKDKKVTIAHASRIAGFDEETQKEATERIKSGEKSKDVIDGIRKPAEKNVQKNEEQNMYDTATVKNLLFDSDDDDEEAFWKNSSDVFVERDTTEEIKQLKSSNLKTVIVTDDDKAAEVIKWASKICKKKKFSDVEKEAFEALRDMLEYVESMEGSSLYEC